MKFTSKINEENSELSISYIEKEGDERAVTKSFMHDKKPAFGELHITEGIKELEYGAFVDKFYHTYFFPKSLEKVGENLFEIYNYNTISKIKIVYPGTSEEFMKIAPERVEEKFESDGFDRYPYYSGGSRWVTYYHSFDDRVADIEVECEGDGVTLLYGNMRNREEGKPPEIKNNHE